MGGQGRWGSGTLEGIAIDRLGVKLLASHDLMSASLTLCVVSDDDDDIHRRAGAHDLTTPPGDPEAHHSSI